MDDSKCGNCYYFRQHYVLFCGTRFDPIPCGHCVYPRLKHRNPNTYACVHYKALDKTKAASLL